LIQILIGPINELGTSHMVTTRTNQDILNEEMTAATPLWSRYWLDQSINLELVKWSQLGPIRTYLMKRW